MRNVYAILADVTEVLILAVGAVVMILAACVLL
jgi:hypothetical protein